METACTGANKTAGGLWLFLRVKSGSTGGFPDEEGHFLTYRFKSISLAAVWTAGQQGWKQEPWESYYSN